MARPYPAGRTFAFVTFSDDATAKTCLQVGVEFQVDGDAEEVTFVKPRVQAGSLRSHGSIHPTEITE